MDDNEIDKALGSSGSFKVRSGGGPLEWLGMLYDVQQKLLLEKVLWQTTTEGVQPKVFDITAPMGVLL